MDCSCFMDKAFEPTDNDVEIAIGNESYNAWKRIIDIVAGIVPKYSAEWKYPGAKHGWSYRLMRGQRIIIYLLPRNGCFRIAMVFNEKSYKSILDSDISDYIKNELIAATPYVEGRGIRIDVAEDETIDDIEKMIKIKTQK